jgi:hypothetical protein
MPETTPTAPNTIPMIARVLAEDAALLALEAASWASWAAD